jgi:hypothetical protein
MTVEFRKMVVATLVTVLATAAAVAAAGHSRRILAKEATPYPPGTLQPGQPAQLRAAGGTLEVRVDDADVLSAVASAQTHGYGLETLASDRRFLRLKVYVRNTSSQPISLGRALKGLRLVQIAVPEPGSKRVVWLRGYDALTPGPLKPGEEVAGKIALDVSSFALSRPSLVETSDGGPRWGLDVIDHKAVAASNLVAYP